MSAANAVGLAGWMFIWKCGFIMGEGSQQGDDCPLLGLALHGGPGVGLQCQNLPRQPILCFIQP